MGRVESPLCGRKVLYLMVCTIEGRPDQVVHAGIHYQEVLGLATLDEEYS